jgi:hypothetical protein
MIPARAGEARNDAGTGTVAMVCTGPAPIR